MINGADTLRHELPQEFSDEDRWQIWRISVSRKTFLALLAGGGVTYLLFKAFSIFHASIVGVVVGLVIMVVMVLLSALPIPEIEYIKGGGLTLDIIVLRRFVRKMNRIVYTKGITDYSKKKRKG